MLYVESHYSICVNSFCYIRVNASWHTSQEQGFFWRVLQHCTGFARLVWGRLRVHHYGIRDKSKPFILSLWYMWHLCVRRFFFPSAMKILEGFQWPKKSMLLDKHVCFHIHFTQQLWFFCLTWYRLYLMISSLSRARST